MKIVLAFLLSINIYAADIKSSLLNFYKKKDYEQVCTTGFGNFKDYSNDEEFITIYAFGCLYADYIDRLAVPITTLKLSPEARANASYLSVILMQKKLLFHSLIDGYDISSLNLPTTDYILSKVFDLYSKEAKPEKKLFYTFVDEADSSITYKLYLINDQKLNKMVIEKFQNSVSVEKHIYW